MNPSGPSQTELSFTTKVSQDGLVAWQQQRRQAMTQLAQRIGLPLGQRVEVWLRDGVRLVGALKLREEKLFLDEARDPNLELTVDGVNFTPTEIESCVRMD